MTASSASAAACRSVVQIYDAASGPVHALKGLTLDIRAGAVTAIVGPSGAGKSTLLRLLACLERPTVGEVEVGGVRTSHLGSRARRRLAAAHVGYVFQTPGDNLVLDLTVSDHLRTAWRMRAPRERPDEEALLEDLELGGLATARPGELAVGEQQRLSFAMASAGAPALVIADEPTASLDPDSARRLVDLLGRLAARGQSMVISTHDPLVISAADHVLVIRNGTLAMAVDHGGPALAVIDDAGRMALPGEAEGMFPDGRARASVEGDHLRVERP